jgi:hypothetical protein
LFLLQLVALCDVLDFCWSAGELGFWLIVHDSGIIFVHNRSTITWVLASMARIGIMIPGAS